MGDESDREGHSSDLSSHSTWFSPPNAVLLCQGGGIYNLIADPLVSLDVGY